MKSIRSCSTDYCTMPLFQTINRCFQTGGTFHSSQRQYLFFSVFTQQELRVIIVLRTLIFRDFFSLAHASGKILRLSQQNRSHERPVCTVKDPDVRVVRFSEPSCPCSISQNNRIKQIETQYTRTSTQVKYGFL